MNANFGEIPSFVNKLFGDISANIFFFYQGFLSQALMIHRISG